MGIEEIIASIKNSEETFLKFASANDAGKTGAHQAGIYIPKNTIPMFSEIDGPRGENRNAPVTLIWENDVETTSKLIYYGKAKNEYRITRLGRGIKVGALFILVKLEDQLYRAFIIDEGIEELLNRLGLDKKTVGKGIVVNGKSKAKKTPTDLFGHASKTSDHNESEIQASFKPRARLLLQLGDQLIKNENIAIIELVKNSYDADANEVNIYMDNVDDSKLGVIIIEDDGFGMTAEVVEHVWLEPGSDFKTQKIKKLEVSPKYERLPIGEKGIGRFGVHKLGNVIEMTTKAMGSKEVYVRIDWREFNKYKYLEDVPIKIFERSRPEVFKNNKTGTNIVISNLRTKWTRGMARGVKRSITALVSPFEAIDSFNPKFDIFDKPGWFEGLLNWEKVKDYSLFHFNTTIKGDAITKFDYEFSPWQSMPKISGKTIGMNEKIVKTFSPLEDSRGKSISLKKYDIGEIIFKGYIFELDAFIMKLGVTDKSGFKTYLRENGGVRVFRDGLRVYDYGEPENDWLDLNLRRVNQPSKKISNNIILGAIYLKRKESSDLVEKTNREGFVENDAYRAFKSSILHSIELVEALRYIDKSRLKEVYGPTRKSAPVMHLLGEVKDYVDRKVREPEIRKQLNKYLIKIESDYKRVNENLLKAAGAGLSLSVVIHEVEKIILELTKVLDAENGSLRVLKLVKHLSSLIDGYSEIISQSNKSSENLTEIINQALFNIEYRIDTHEITIVKEYLNFHGTSNLKVARNLMISSLMNLLDNSIYWLEKAKRGNQNLQKKIFLNISENDKHIYLVIADNGTGFLVPTDDIVEPFVSAKPGGIGLGLHIASEIMEAQNGRLIFPDWGDYEIPEEYKDGAIIVFEFNK